MAYRRLPRVEARASTICGPSRQRTPAAGSGPRPRAQDELASTMEQSFDSIEFRIDIRPEQAASDLEAEGRAAPAARATGARAPRAARATSRSSANCRTTSPRLSRPHAGDAAVGGGATQVPTAPEAFTTGMEPGRPAASPGRSRIPARRDRAGRQLSTAGRDKDGRSRAALRRRSATGPRPAARDQREDRRAEGPDRPRSRPSLAP